MLEWFSLQLLVNSEMFKLSFNLSLMHLRAKSACYELKGDLRRLILKEIFHGSLKISSWFLCRRPPLLLSNQNCHATQAS